MLIFIVRRIIQGLGILWGLITLLFLIFYVLDSPVNYMVGENADEKIVKNIVEKYGLDRPLLTQYADYLHRLSPVRKEKEKWVFDSPDLGVSYQNDKPVGELIGEHWFGSAVLALFSLLFASFFGISMGIIAGLYKDRFPDRLIVSLSVLGISAPSFFVAVLLIAIFSVALNSLTHLNATGYLMETGVYSGESRIVWKNLFLPVIALGVRPLAVFVQLTRASLSEVMQTDYIRTARAKGLSPLRVLIVHALRNALNPVITSVTGWLASLLAGAFFVEFIFNWKGIGKLAIEALQKHDFPVILGCTLMVGIVFVGVSILTDVLYKISDPRVTV
ncbi:MAG: ABC transporter permease [Bacteroidia bacterium]|nr:ABC transporter permease [Bacteroidia bacterium]